MTTTFGHAFPFRSTAYALLTLGAISLSSTALAARRPCDCDNLELIEEHIDQQEFLRKLFQQWAEYMPNSLRTPSDVRARANALFQLTFYGVNTEVPHGTGSGAGAAFGTLPAAAESQSSADEILGPPTETAPSPRLTEEILDPDANEPLTSDEDVVENTEAEPIANVVLADTQGAVTFRTMETSSLRATDVPRYSDHPSGSRGSGRQSRRPPCTF